MDACEGTFHDLSEYEISIKRLKLTLKVIPNLASELVICIYFWISDLSIPHVPILLYFLLSLLALHNSDLIYVSSSTVINR